MSADTVVIGAGHNGLTAAAYLAKGGRKVLVLDQRDEIGGLAGVREFHPGYRSPGVLQDTSLVRSKVVADLQLEKHGLRRRIDRTSVLVPGAERPGLVLHADPKQAIDELRRTERDAEGYASFLSFIEDMQGYVTELLDRPPPSIAPGRIGEHVSLFRKVLGLRRLGQRTMYECLRIGPMSVQDWLEEHFKSGALQAGLAAPALTGLRTGPRAAGTASLLLLYECLAEGEVIGGPAALVQALAAACAEHKVEVRCGTAVRRIRVRDGKVAGVELAGGESVDAARVVSTVDPTQTLLELISPPDLPAGLELPLRNWRCRGTTAVVHLAVEAQLDFASRPGQLFDSVCVSDDLEQLERAFDAVKYRQLPEVPYLDIRVPTVWDQSLAPEGHHVVSILAHAVPYGLDGGWDDAAREELLKRVLARLGSVSPGASDLIVGHELLTPIDLEREYRLTGGHLHHGEHGLDQLLSMRPAASCARYATPIKGLYLAGSGSHPGGGITCAPGMLGAAAVR